MKPALCRGLPALQAALAGACALSAALGAAGQGLTASDIAVVYAQAAGSAHQLQPGLVIAIVDRDGRELLVRAADGTQNFTAAQEAIAVSKAGTAVFLSSGGEALTSRTAGFIVQQHFPPGIDFTPPGPLVGVEFSSMAFSDVNSFRRLDGSRIPGTRLYGSPGGVPLYRNGVLLAGIGVTGAGPEVEDGSISGPDTNERVSLAGQVGYEPPPQILANNIFVGGIRFPYVASSAGPPPAPSQPDTVGLTAPAPVEWPIAVLGGVRGEIRAPIIGDPVAGEIEGQPRLTAAEVSAIIANAAARTLVTRAGIRLPAGQSAETFIAVVNNPNQAGQAPVVLGTFRTPDATVFSWDVAVQKARTALFFSNDIRAFSCRTVGFLAQAMYPPGIDNEPPGPFNGMQERFSAPIINGSGAVDANLPNGITIFPGGFPLYRNGVLIGAIGVSGDGVDQDDLIAASGALGFQPKPAIRADNFTYLGARLPYAVFPRAPMLIPRRPPRGANVR
ncbi:MAG TPA: heme-binding protein [Opitutaceae bacterium]|nr:heme-binding protein [Opitutaceae bacterium]